VKARLILLLAAAPALVWAAISAAPTASAATIVNATIHTPADVQINPCSPGDVVNLNGDIHIVITTTANGRDGYQFKNQMNAHLSGVSITTGTKYVSNQTTNTQWSTGTLPVVHREVQDYLLVSQSKTPNYVLHMTVRETINDAGAVDVTAEKWSADCQGKS
jgi:NMD protein affecting ribosome stability and mRNA decay